MESEIKLKTCQFCGAVAPSSNTAARDALRRIDTLLVAMNCDSAQKRVVDTCRMIVKRALSAPPRQCDVGTPSEQADRHRDLCLKYGGCSTCPRNKDEWSYKDCILDWAQTPYESKAKK